MALEALCGVPKRSFMAESRLFEHEELEAKDEIMASFPNADDPMKVLTPPFVRKPFYPESPCKTNCVFDLAGTNRYGQHLVQPGRQ